MTQAIAFSHLLSSQGHELLGVILGKSKRRDVPDFFKREIKVPIHLVESPNFECDGSDKKILIWKTIQVNSLKSRTFWNSLQKIDQVVKEVQPDVILNFYDLLGGIYNFLFRPNPEFWTIGHQYLIEHPDFPFASGRLVEKTLFQINTWITSLGAQKKLALSFFPQAESSANIIVVPPLLRKEVKSLRPRQEDFYLAYMVNPGYGKEVMAFAEKYHHLKIKAYWDNKNAAEIEHPLPNLSFFRINDQTFLQDMATCKGLVCTAGFESVCEAMYLGKPVLMIPVAGQYEQACNALDAEASGAGIASENFDFGKLETAQKKDTEISLYFQEWVDVWPSILCELILSIEQESGVKNQDSELDPSTVFG